MAKWIPVLAVLLIIGGTAAIGVTALDRQIGGAATEDAATYHMWIEGDHVGTVTIVRAPDDVRPGADGELVQGQLFQAEWQVEGVRIATEEVLLAEGEVVWRRGTAAFGVGILTGMEATQDQGLMDVERVRFAGPTPLCGFILGAAHVPDDIERLPGCAEPFTATKGGDWRLDGNGLVISVAGGDVWPSRVAWADYVDVVFQRDIVGKAPGLQTDAMGRIETPEPSPADLFGADDAGMAGWPIVDAVERASTDLFYSELRDYRAAHPDAVVAQAVYSQYADGDGWALSFSDGTSRFDILAKRDASTTTQRNPAFELARGGDYTFETVAGDSATFPAPAQRPAQMPSYAETLSAWHDATGDNLPSDAYGFTTACTPSCGGAQVWVGLMQKSDMGIDFGGWDPGLEAGIDKMTVDERGHLVGLDRYGSFTMFGWSSDPSTPFLLTFAQLAVAPVGGVAILGGIVALVMVLAKSSPLAGLFSRVHGAQALASPERQRIMQIVQAKPGVHHSEIVRVTGKGNGSVEHHLRTLLRTGHVTRKTAGGFVCYYAKGALDRRVMDALPVLKADLAKSILTAIEKDPGLTGAELSRLTGAENSTISYHLKRLEGAGLIERRRSGRVIEAYPEALAGQALKAAA